MASEPWVRVDGGIDAKGKSWTVGWCGPVVLLAVDPAAVVLEFDAEKRDQFMHAWAVAESQAEAYANAAESSRSSR